MPYTGYDPLLFLEGMVENLPWVSWESAEWGLPSQVHAPWPLLALALPRLWSREGLHQRPVLSQQG